MEQLGINLPGLIAQIINFLLFYFLLKKFVWPSVLGMLESRQQRIRESMDRATELQQQATAAQTEFEAQMARSRQEAQEIVTRALASAERIKADAESDARKQGDALIARARAEIQMERDRVIGELRSEFADVTIQAAEKVINQSLDKSRHIKLIEDVLAESSAFKAAP